MPSHAVTGSRAHTSSITCDPFGTTAEGLDVDRYRLENSNGTGVRIATFGGIITDLVVPDRRGDLADVVLGHDTLDPYLTDTFYLGALIGRYANRIAGGVLDLNGETHQLSRNEAGNTLHGGMHGFDNVVWTVADAQVSADGPQLTLRHLSPDGDEGFPGNLEVTATYTLTDDNELRLDFTATTDESTVVNLTQHSYFNLRGHGDVLAHEVRINAGRFTPIDAALLPTGELRPVDQTPFDLRGSASIRSRLELADEQLTLGNGYDHNWVIDKPPGTLGLMATVYEPYTGRVLEVSSTQPGLQFYSGNFLDGTVVGKRGRVLAKRSGFCMEPQHFPDSPHHPSFPATELLPGETYRNTIIYRFRVDS